MSIYKEPPPGMCIVPDGDDLTKVRKFTKRQQFLQDFGIPQPKIFQLIPAWIDPKCIRKVVDSDFSRFLVCCRLYLHTVNALHPLQIHALITGPFDTPYEGGFFYFLIRCPPDYPIRPPRVKLITTGSFVLQTTLMSSCGMQSKGQKKATFVVCWGGHHYETFPAFEWHRQRHHLSRGKQLPFGEGLPCAFGGDCSLSHHLCGFCVQGGTEKQLRRGTGRVSSLWEPSQKSQRHFNCCQPISTNKRKMQDVRRVSVQNTSVKLQCSSVFFFAGDGQVRFNPNLYKNGKVCLSILG